MKIKKRAAAALYVVSLSTNWRSQTLFIKIIFSLVSDMLFVSVLKNSHFQFCAVIKKFLFQF